MDHSHKLTPKITVIQTGCVLITTTHGTYPVNVKWVDLTPERIEALYKLRANTSYLARISASEAAA